MRTEAMELLTFTQRVVLAHYDAIPMLISAETPDGRKWGGMMLAPGDYGEYEYTMLMFRVADDAFPSFEEDSRDPLEDDYLRNLMLAADECWFGHWCPDITATIPAVQAVAATEMPEFALPSLQQ